MKLPLVSALVLLLAAAQATASPDTAADETLDVRAISRPQNCAIVGGATSVNCRSGPSTKHGIKAKLTRGRAYDFWCVYTGKNRECITLNGLKNCGWHYSKALKCYVNGHYTDNRCTLARMGTCSGDDDNNMSNF